MLEIMWKSGLVWLSRLLNKVFDLWANFGPLRAKISKIGWGTPTFYWSPRLYLPIGIQNWPYFGWDISSHFLPWVEISGETCAIRGQIIKTYKCPKISTKFYNIFKIIRSHIKIGFLVKKNRQNLFLSTK